MFRSIIRCKVYFDTRFKYICKKACTGIGALRTVWDTTRLGYMMTSNKFSKSCPRRGKQRRPRSAFFPQYFESCDFRQWGISDAKKNGVRWTFPRSLELKRPKTRVFLLNSLPDKVQKNLKKEGECQILILGKSFFEICLLMVECLVLCKLFLYSAVLLKMQQWVAP